jgi:hypothetical protein
LCLFFSLGLVGGEDGAVVARGLMWSPPSSGRFLLRDGSLSMRWLLIFKSHLFESFLFDNPFFLFSAKNWTGSGLKI